MPDGQTPPGDSAEDGGAKRRASLERLSENAERRRAEAREAGEESCSEFSVELEEPRQYCRGCGMELTDFEEPGQCPLCGRGFDPNDPKTYRDEPLPQSRRPYLLQTPRLAGYAWVVCFLVGRIVIGDVGPDWVSGVSGQSGSSPAGAAAGAVVAVLSGLMLVPWLLCCAWLGLAAVAEHHNAGQVHVAMPLGMGLAVLMVLGLNPAMLIAAALLGAFAGLVRAWRAT
ncbi:MAG: hypothetical protein AAFX76_03120 [Planctomycetota bacterium]